MVKLKRRDFLKYSGIGGALLLSEISQFGLIGNAFSEDVKELNLTASVTPVDLGNGKKFKAWTYNGQIPGPEIRVKEGEILRVVLKNNLPEDTTIHWHGVPVPNKMDGVPNVTQKPIKPGKTDVRIKKDTLIIPPHMGSGAVEFVADNPGIWFHHCHNLYHLAGGMANLVKNM